MNSKRRPFKTANDVFCEGVFCGVCMGILFMLFLIFFWHN